MRRPALITALTGLALGWAAAPAPGQGEAEAQGGFHRGDDLPPRDRAAGQGPRLSRHLPSRVEAHIRRSGELDPAAPLKASVVSLPGNAWLFRYDSTSGQPITVTVMVICPSPVRSAPYRWA